ncbi:MAG: M20/M25/M40 family metallo-hydrolase [Vicinamibacteria bacterium]|nr:M20/M25/M40 family metallo-hydrolase [Vicinamibacteria bacterium]
MRRVASSFLVAALALTGPAWAQAKKTGSKTVEAPIPAWLVPYRPVAERILATTRDAGGNFAWDRLAFMTDTFGPRLSGSANLDATLRWAEAEMKKDGLENVRLEPVMVPQWIRGDESLEILEPFPNKVPILGLGGSVSTRAEGVVGELMIVKSFDELTARKDEARGRIVLFNVVYTNYGETVRYRGGGASAAARVGALAALVRAVGPPGMRTPHTGGMRYEEGIPKIPTAAIPTEDADRFERMAKRGQKITLRLRMDAHFLDDAPSANVVGEIRGTEKPDEIVLVGGHIDSWDPGTGAMDDGGGCVVTWEALRLLKTLGLKPKRTIRVVLFTNEENGGAGGNGYRDAHKAELEKHVLALESDSGVFRPRGFGFTGSDAARKTLTEIASLLKPLGADAIAAQGGGADIGPAVAAGKIPSASLEVEGSKYFLLHHTPADTVDKLDPKDLADNAAAIAFLAYVVADLPAPLPRP